MSCTSSFDCESAKSHRMQSKCKPQMSIMCFAALSSFHALSTSKNLIGSSAYVLHVQCVYMYLCAHMQMYLYNLAMNSHSHIYTYETMWRGTCDRMIAGVWCRFCKPILSPFALGSNPTTILSCHRCWPSTSTSWQHGWGLRSGRGLPS